MSLVSSSAFTRSWLAGFCRQFTFPKTRAKISGLYLQQEIVAEGVTRNVPAFSRFLRTAALCNATVVNFTKVASDAQVPRTTVYEYFDVLKDTLILHELPAWKTLSSAVKGLDSRLHENDGQALYRTFYEAVNLAN